MAAPKNPWEHVRAPDVSRNPFINPATPPPPGGAGGGSGGAPLVTTAISNAGDYLKLENIVCTDADGTVFESYPELYLAKDIVRNPDTTQISKKPYDWAVYFEPQGLFLPSFALTCNILEALFRTYQSDPEAKKVLDQYKDKGNGDGYHAQNTIVNFGTSAVIHYPTPADWAQTGGVNVSSARKALAFSKTTLQDSLVAGALRNPSALRYLRQLTGLRDPAVLVDIGTYFGKPAKQWFPWSGQHGDTQEYTRAAWLGCGNNNFSLDANGNLNSTDAARGVRFGASAASGGRP